MEDKELIKKIKESNDNDSLLKITAKHIKIYNFVCAKYKKNIRDFDFELEAPLFFYNCAKSFDENKNMKFSTFLAQNARYMCLKLIKKQSCANKFINDEILCLHAEDKDEPLYVNKDSINNILKDDERARNIIESRYFSGTVKPKTFKEIAKKHNLSTMFIKTIHDNSIKKLKTKYTHE